MLLYGVVGRGDDGCDGVEGVVEVECEEGEFFCRGVWLGVDFLVADSVEDDCSDVVTDDVDATNPLLCRRC